MNYVNKRLYPSESNDETTLLGRLQAQYELCPPRSLRKMQYLLRIALQLCNVFAKTNKIEDLDNAKSHFEQCRMLGETVAESNMYITL
jgi:hypothetical protein